MTDEELESIRKRCEAATPGIWGIAGDKMAHCEITALYEYPVPEPEKGEADGLFLTDGHAMMGVMFLRSEELDPDDDPCMPDMDFITHARTDIPALLAEVVRLRAENERLKEACHIYAGLVSKYERERE